jgi:hypothetical protein
MEYGQIYVVQNAYYERGRVVLDYVMAFSTREKAVKYIREQYEYIGVQVVDNLNYQNVVYTRGFMGIIEKAITSKEAVKSKQALPYLLIDRIVH